MCNSDWLRTGTSCDLDPGGHGLRLKINEVRHIRARTDVPLAKIGRTVVRTGLYFDSGVQ
jgi:hypothetical protein